MSPKKARLRGEMRGAIVSAKTEINRRVTIPEDQLSDELLLGIPNHVTLKLIATKLPWRAWQVAATLSADWHRAFQGRMVYDARVRWQTTQTFFVVLCDFSTDVSIYNWYRECMNISLHKRTLSLFSPSEERWFGLPPLPGCHSGMAPYYFNYVFLDGSIYHLGGARDDIGCIPGKEVHVLDLARYPLEWRQCASMQARRSEYNIGVMHGKIFVFAEWSEDIAYRGRNEVYDPKLDAWSWIAPMRPWTYVCKVGQQFFVCIGQLSRSRPENPAEMEPVRDEEAEEETEEKDEESEFMADLYDETKLVVIDGHGCPKLISTSDDDAVDNMDGLHGIIENCLDDLEARRPDLGEIRTSSSPAEDLASDIDFIEQEAHRHGSFLNVYDPVKDEWRVLERDVLGTHNVDRVQPEKIIDLRYATAKLWSMSL